MILIIDYLQYQHNTEISFMLSIGYFVKSVICIVLNLLANILHILLSKLILLNNSYVHINLFPFIFSISILQFPFNIHYFISEY